MSKLGKLKELLNSINDRINGICFDRCTELGLDCDKIIGKTSNRKRMKEKSDSDLDDMSESSSSSTVVKNPSTDGDGSINSAVDDELNNGDRFGAADVSGDLEKAKAIVREMNNRLGKSANDNQYETPKIDNGDGKEDYDEYRSRKNAIQSELKRNYKVSDSSVDPNLKAGEIGLDKSGNGIGAIVKNFIKKRLVKRLAKQGAKSASKYGGKIFGKKLANIGVKQGVKSGGKIVGKRLAKQGAKSVGKIAAKKLPFGIGFIPAMGFAADRFSGGDVKGGLLELASGGAASVPFIGTAGSLGIDGYLAKRDYEKDVGESYLRYASLYDRAKSVFESSFGINESVDGYRFDDYVLESRIGNGILDNERRIDESFVFYGYETISESFNTDRDELERLFKKLSPTDGKVTIEKLMPNQMDSSDIRKTKDRIRKLLENGQSAGINTNLNQKEYKKVLDLGRNSSGKLTKTHLWHKGLDDTANSVSDILSDHGIPHGLSDKWKIPRRLANLAGAGLGGLFFGPVGAAAGLGLTQLLANSHDRYKKEQYDKLHGNGDDSSDGILKSVEKTAKNVGKDAKDNFGGLVGAGIGTLLGGPVMGIVGAGLGNLGQKAYRWLASKKDNKAEMV